jgi:16S rRNA (cytidine1402-2'-O)-methyltransferase
MKDSDLQILKPGLYVVATPIGNLRDITLRAIDTLKSVDLILCEDSRVFSKLAQAYGIETPKRSLHEHNEKQSLGGHIEKLKGGGRIALVSDAGTPTISDPGFPLVRACRAENVPVFTIPGPSAAISALSISGLEPDQFLFAGFLPVKPGKKRSTLEELLALNQTLIFYESPHKIVATLELLKEISPAARVCLFRELTKIYEEMLSGTPEEVLTQLSPDKVRGEIVLILGRTLD